jgi:hypothetical protein
VEYGVHHISQSDAPADHSLDTLMVATGMYQQLLTAPRKPIVRYTAIIEINPDLDIPTVSAANVCDERSFLARLLGRVVREAPSVVVIDKRFGRNSCAASDAGTRETCRGREGGQGNSTGVGRGGGAPSRRAHPHAIGSIALRCRQPRSRRTTAPNAGLVNVADDNRRLPLNWLVYPNLASTKAGQPYPVDSLGLAAAKLHEPRLLQDNSRLASVLDKGEQPFLGFLTPEQYAGHRIYASEALCGHRLANDEEWRTCSVDNPLPISLRGRVVVIGESSPYMDQHRTIVGRIPGFYLHANYVEALLDDRFFRPAGPLPDVAFSLVFLVVLELILVLFHHSVWRAAASIAALVCVTVLALYFIVFFWTIYLDPILITGAALAIKIMHLAFASVPRVHLRADTSACQS